MPRRRWQRSSVAWRKRRRSRRSAACMHTGHVHTGHVHTAHAHVRACSLPPIRCGFRPLPQAQLRQQAARLPALGGGRGAGRAGFHRGGNFRPARPPEVHVSLPELHIFLPGAATSPGGISPGAISPGAISPGAISPGDDDEHDDAQLSTDTPLSPEERLLGGGYKPPSPVERGPSPSVQVLGSAPVAPPSATARSLRAPAAAAVAAATAAAAEAEAEAVETTTPQDRVVAPSRSLLRSASRLGFFRASSRKARVGQLKLHRQSPQPHLRETAECPPHVAPVRRKRRVRDRRATSIRSRRRAYHYQLLVVALLLGTKCIGRN